VCTSCHGINTRDQANHVAPTNEPEALRQLLAYWKVTRESLAAPTNLRIVSQN